MLHLALAALLATSFGLGDIATPVDGEKEKVFRTQATVGLAPADEAPITATYAFGQPEPTFLNAWAGFGFGRATQRYDHTGNTVDTAERTIQRAFLGAEANLFPIGGLTFSLGAELLLGAMTVDGEPDISFGLHTVKFWGQLRGRTLGAHAGYVLDLGDDPDPANPLHRLSPGHDAILVGFTFDHQPAWVRTFGGVDYFRFVDAPGHDGVGWDSPALIVYTVGLGVSVADWVDLGVASIWRANTVHAAIPLPIREGSSHTHAFSPYVHLSPPFLPVGISIRGAVPRDYADTAFTTGGSRDFASSFGITGALTWGF
jgi:hypothetical protein